MKHIKLYENLEPRVLREYYPTGELHEETWVIERGLIHRVDGPAMITYDMDGRITRKQWWKEGKCHRLDGPSDIKYYPDGKVKTEVWMIGGILQRDGGPAIIDYYPSGKPNRELWRQNDTLHREDGPAWISYYPDGSIRIAAWYFEGDEIHGLEIEAILPTTSEERLLELGRKPGNVGRLAKMNKNYPDESDWLFRDF